MSFSAGLFLRRQNKRTPLDPRVLETLKPFRLVKASKTPTEIAPHFHHPKVMTTRLLLQLAAFSFVVTVSRGGAQNPPNPGQPGVTPAAPAAGAVKTMRAVRTSSSINIDGKLNEAAWASAPAATG